MQTMIGHVTKHYFQDCGLCFTIHFSEKVGQKDQEFVQMFWSPNCDYHKPELQK